MSAARGLAAASAIVLLSLAGPAASAPTDGEVERLRGLLGALKEAPESDRPDAWADLLARHRELVAAHARAPGRDVGAALTTSGWWLYSYRRYGEDVDPVRLLEETFAGARSFGDAASIGGVASVLAGLLRDRGDVERAAARLAEASERVPADHPLAARLAVERADLLRHAGETGAARALLDEVEPGIGDDAAGRRLRIELDGVRGLVELAEGRPERAAWTLARAVDAARAAGEPTLYRNAVLRRLNLALAVEDAAGALALADAALAEEWAWADAPASAAAQLEARRGHALAELERDDPSRRRRAAGVLEAVIATGALAPGERVDARLSLAEVRLRAGDHAAAGRALDVAAAAFGPADGAAPAIGDAARQRRRHAVLSSALDRARGAGRDVLAAHLERLEAALAAFLDAWRRTPARPDGQGFLHFGGPRQLSAEIVRLACAVEPGEPGVGRALAALLAGQALGSVTRARGGEVPGVAEIRERLAPDEVLLVFLPAPDRSHLVLVDADRLVHFPLASDVSLFERRRAFLEVAARPPPAGEAGRQRRAERLRERGAELRDALLPEEALEAARGRRRWTVVGVDLLGTLPFEALPLDGGRWVGVEHAVAYAPSVPLVHVLAEAPWRRAGEVDLTWIADPAPPPAGAPSLGFEGAGAARMFSGYAPAETRGWRGEAATRARLAEAARAAGVALHVWTHGVRSDDDPIPAGLHLADGAVYGAAAGLLDAPPLVLLSSCGAARGPVRRGEDGASNLGGAFLRAGARAVVLPSIDVDSGATLALMERFHDAWRGGASAAEALRRARAALAAAPALADPYHWAFVHVVGAARTPAYPPRSAADGAASGGRVALGGLALLAVALAVVVRLSPRRARPPPRGRAPRR